MLCDTIRPTGAVPPAAFHRTRDPPTAPTPRSAPIVSTMDDAHRAELGELLRERRASVDETLAVLTSDLEALAAARTDSTADDEHDPEGVTLSGEWSRLEGLRVQQERERTALDAAIARWDAGDYGVCKSCGRPIPVGRLRVRPMATLCVSCAERAGV